MKKLLLASLLLAGATSCYGMNKKSEALSSTFGPVNEEKVKGHLKKLSELVATAGSNNGLEKETLLDIKNKQREELNEIVGHLGDPMSDEEKEEVASELADNTSMVLAIAESRHYCWFVRQAVIEYCIRSCFETVLLRKFSNFDDKDATTGSLDKKEILSSLHDLLKKREVIRTLAVLETEKKSLETDFEVNSDKLAAELSPFLKGIEGAVELKCKIRKIIRKLYSLLDKREILRKLFDLSAKEISLETSSGVNPYKLAEELFPSLEGVKEAEELKHKIKAHTYSEVKELSGVADIEELKGMFGKYFYPKIKELSSTKDIKELNNKFKELEDWFLLLKRKLQDFEKVKQSNKAK